MALNDHHLKMVVFGGLPSATSVAEACIARNKPPALAGGGLPFSEEEVTV